jgi:hypothetical protein
VKLAYEAKPPSPCDPIIKLAVGDGPDIVHVHRGVLCKTSAYFNTALKSVWTSQRPDDHTLDMSTDSLEHLRTYVRWAYTGHVQIPLRHNSPELPREEHAKEAERVYIELAHALVFGERVVDTSYVNALILLVIEAWKASRWSPGPEFATIVYNGTPGHPVRRLFTDMVYRMAYNDSSSSVGWMATLLPGYPKEALVDVTKAFVQHRGISLNSMNPWVSAPSGYLIEDEARIQGTERQA